METSLAGPWVPIGERRREGAGQIHAMTVSLGVVLRIAGLGLGAVWLLPRKAAAPQH